MFNLLKRPMITITYSRILITLELNFHPNGEPYLDKHRIKEKAELGKYKSRTWTIANVRDNIFIAELHESYQIETITKSITGDVCYYLDYELDCVLNPTVQKEYDNAFQIYKQAVNNKAKSLKIQTDELVVKTEELQKTKYDEYVKFVEGKKDNTTIGKLILELPSYMTKTDKFNMLDLFTRQYPDVSVMVVTKGEIGATIVYDSGETLKLVE